MRPYTTQLVKRKCEKKHFHYNFAISFYTDTTEKPSEESVIFLPIFERFFLIPIFLLHYIEVLCNSLCTGNAALVFLIFNVIGWPGKKLTNSKSEGQTNISASSVCLSVFNLNYVSTIAAKHWNETCLTTTGYLLRLPSCLMMAARVLFVTHSSSLVTPSGRAPRHRCLGSMFLFTSGMML